MSNQSFEYWIYLHFNFSDAALHRDVWNEKLDDIFRQYNLGDCTYRKNYDNIYDLECATRKYLKQLYTKNFQSRFASISNIYSYFNLIEMHNSDIIGIVEAIRYGVDKEKLLKKLLI